jgi:hypothetical protein
VAATAEAVATFDRPCPSLAGLPDVADEVVLTRMALRCGARDIAAPTRSAPPSVGPRRTRRTGRGSPRARREGAVVVPDVGVRDDNPPCSVAQQERLPPLAGRSPCPYMDDGGPLHG